MHLLFSKISNNNHPIKLKKEIPANVEFDSKKDTFNITYDPLNISITSKNSGELVNLFMKQFVTIWSGKDLPENIRFQKHLNQIVEV